ncbi:MAG: MarC family protein [Simkaniaceae bacterium]
MLFSTVVSLFLVINAVGNIPLFISLLARFEPKDQRRIIIRELILAFAVLLLFNYFGNHILRLLQITRPIIGIAGGILLFLTALGMIFPKEESTEPPLHEPIFVPLAMPVIAGPGAITFVMAYASQVQNSWLMTLAIFLAWLPSLLILLAASNIKYFLGKKGLTAIERFGGMIVTLIAINMLISGLVQLIKESFF